MKTSRISLVAIATIGAALLAANTAAAGWGFGGGNGGGNGGGHGNHNGGLKISFGGGHHDNHHNNHNNHHNNHHVDHKHFDHHHFGHHYYYPSYYWKSGSYYRSTVPVIVGQTYLSQAFEPLHSSYIVLPGDTLYVISLKEYGSSTPATYIARFNSLPPTAALVPGQMLMLPSISSTGLLTQSGAPAAEIAPQGPIAQPLAAPVMAPAMSQAPASNVKPVVEEARPKFTVGSTLLVDGQSFGDKRGVVRLRISGLSLPIEVLEWTTSSVKIRLPMVEVTSATIADIEVLRADGSLASKSSVELSAASEKLAISK